MSEGSGREGEGEDRHLAMATAGWLQRNQRFGSLAVGGLAGNVLSLGWAGVGLILTEQAFTRSRPIWSAYDFGAAFYEIKAGFKSNGCTVPNERKSLAM